MHFKDLIKTRYSVREYHDNKIDRTLIKEVVNAGRLAPSAANKQPWKFVVVDDPELLKKVKATYNRDWFQNIPAIIIIYGDHNNSWKRSFDNKDHCDIDAAIAIDHMTLMASDLGLGTCWVCHFNVELLNQIIIVKENWEPIALLSIGYPKQQISPEKNRKNIDDVLSFNSF